VADSSGFSCARSSNFVGVLILHSGCILVAFLIARILVLSWSLPSNAVEIILNAFVNGAHSREPVKNHS
jgi:hypothetical protein